MCVCCLCVYARVLVRPEKLARNPNLEPPMASSSHLNLIPMCTGLFLCQAWLSA